MCQIHQVFAVSSIIFILTSMATDLIIMNEYDHQLHHQHYRDHHDHQRHGHSGLRLLLLWDWRRKQQLWNSAHRQQQMSKVGIMMMIERSVMTILDGAGVIDMSLPIIPGPTGPLVSRSKPAFAKTRFATLQIAKCLLRLSFYHFSFS